MSCEVLSDQGGEGELDPGEGLSTIASRRQEPKSGSVGGGGGGRSENGDSSNFTIVFCLGEFIFTGGAECAAAKDCAKCQVKPDCYTNRVGEQMTRKEWGSLLLRVRSSW